MTKKKASISKFSSDFEKRIQKAQKLLAARVFSPEYHKGVEFIALNDGPGDKDALNAAPLSDTVTVVMLSEMFGISSMAVADDVVEARKGLL